MCGIFGVLQSGKASISTLKLKQLTGKLFKVSMNRGQESSGIAAHFAEKSEVVKDPLSPTRFVRRPRYKTLWREIESASEPVSIIGHSRLVTNGEQGLNHNNQPVVKDGLVAIHNGIIVNVDELWENHADLKRLWDVDTELILSLITKYRNEGNSLRDALGLMYEQIYGVANLSIFFEDLDVNVLSSNNGSLYYARTKDESALVFASEEGFLEEVFASCSSPTFSEIQQLKPNNALVFGLDDGNTTLLDLANRSDRSAQRDYPQRNRVLYDDVSRDRRKREGLKRCTRCILPETFPFITFDGNGVCNYCNSHKKFELKGDKPLFDMAERARRSDTKHDCVVAFSGGRDSSFGLDYVKNTLGLNPVAYTYDWGMVNDLARRNQSRLCASLGVEHVIVSADITTKRKYIRQNMNAWLKRPDLGMVPILMAGDKQYFYYANELARKVGTDLIFFCGNSMEKSGFKSSFCGVKEKSDWYFDVPIMQKFQMGWYYLKQYMLNPSYFNSSLFDTLFAYYSAYFISHDYVMLFDYIPWDEDEINTVLTERYDWEFAGDTKTSWRIGDGTAAFYNYVYYTVAGFSEHDTFRSIQVREDLLSREEALDLATLHNQPRFESIREYAHIIGFDFNKAVHAVNMMPKLYA